MAFSSLGTDVMKQIHEYHTENPKKIIRYIQLREQSSKAQILRALKTF